MKAKIRQVSMARAEIPTVHLPVAGWPTASVHSGTAPTEDNLWLWEDSTPVLWGDGSNIPTDNEQLTISD